MTGVFALHGHGILEVFQHRVFFLTRNWDFFASSRDLLLRILLIFCSLLNGDARNSWYCSCNCKTDHNILIQLGGSTLKTGDDLPTSAKPEKGLSTLNTLRTSRATNTSNLVDGLSYEKSTLRSTSYSNSSNLSWDCFFSRHKIGSGLAYSTICCV